MALQHFYDGALVLDAIQLRDELGFAQSAEIGNVEMVGITVEDPSGTRNFIGWKTWQIKETSASDQVIWNGYVGRQRIHRGDGTQRFHTTVGRVWDLELVECNSILTRKVIRTGANRGSETVSARITWLLTTTGMTGVVVDHGLVETCTTVMDANDYTGQFASDVLRDCALMSGWNFFVRWRAASSDLELVFNDLDISGLDTSTLVISNVLSDVDQVLTWFPGGEATLIRDPTRIAAGVWLPYANGNSYNSNATTAAAFADVDQVAPTSTVKTSGAAAALVTRYLASHNVQDERLEAVRLTVPKANVNDVKHGQAINARFAHLPGWTTSRGCRVLYKSVGLFSESPDAYTMDLILSPMPVPVASSARQEKVTWSSGVAPSETGGNSGWLMHYANNGDYYASGSSSHPLTGLLQYVASGTPAGGPYVSDTNLGTGIRCLGAGNLTVTLRGNPGTVIDVGTSTFVLSILRNGIAVATNSDSYTVGGLSAWGPDVTVSATFAVSIGDVIAGQIGGAPISAYAVDWHVYASASATPWNYYLGVSGSLRVRT